MTTRRPFLLASGTLLGVLGLPSTPAIPEFVRWSHARAEVAARLICARVLGYADERTIAEQAALLVRHGWTVQQGVHSVGSSLLYQIVHLNPFLPVDPYAVVSRAFPRFLDREAREEEVAYHADRVACPGHRAFLREIVFGGEYLAHWGEMGVPGVR